MFEFKLTTEERMTRAKIQLQDNHPFWAYLVMKLKIIKDTENKLPPWGGMGVNTNGELLWKKDFVDQLNESELQFVLAHEVGHLVFGHLFRLNNRNPILFNIASDMVLNDILRENGFTPPKDIILPDYNHKMTIFDVTITDVDKKTAEEIYDLFPRDKQEMISQQMGFDEHFYGEGMSDSQKETAETKWKESLVEAAIYAKQRGKLSGRLEELVGHLINPKFNWKQMLRKYITNMLPYDYSFSRPNRKIPHVILPGVLKESIDIVVHIDTSGSITNQEIAEFMSEVIGIATSHQNLNMTLIECDAEINQIIEVKSSNVSKLKNISIKGRGGTSHKPLWEYLSKKRRQCKLFISLTDFYSDVEKSDRPNCEVIWLIPKSGTEKVPFGKVLRLK